MLAMPVRDRIGAAVDALVVIVAARAAPLGPSLVERFGWALAARGHRRYRSRHALQEISPRGRRALGVHLGGVLEMDDLLPQGRVLRWR
jgi:hypothetical protein